MATLLSRVKAALFGGFLRMPTGPLVHVVPVQTFSPRRGSRAVLDAYQENGWLQLLVDTVAESVARPRWRVFKPTNSRGKAALHEAKRLAPVERQKLLAGHTKRGNLVELEEHELLTLLEKPHPKYTGFAYRKLVQQHLDLNGEAFLWLRRGLDGRPAGFEVVPPPCVLTTPTPASPSFFITYNLMNVTVPEADVLWLKHLDPANPEGRGVGRGQAMGDELDAQEAIEHTIRTTFQRGGLPAAIVGVDSKNGASVEDAVEDLEKRYTESHTGPHNQGKVFFAPGNVTMQALQSNLQHLQMVEAHKALRDYTRHTFGVSPELVGDLTSANRSTSEEAKYTLAEYVTSPRLEFLAAELNHHLVPLVDRDALLVPDDPRPQSWERTLKAMTSAFGPHVKMNEARALGGLPPDPELEGKRFMPLPGAQPVQDGPKEPQNPPPPRGPARD